MCKIYEIVSLKNTYNNNNNLHKREREKKRRNSSIIKECRILKREILHSKNIRNRNLKKHVQTEGRKKSGRKDVIKEGKNRKI